MTEPNIATNPETGVRYYTDDGPLEGLSVDFFVPVQDGEPTNPTGDRWPLRYGRPYDGSEIRFYLKGEPQIRAHDTDLFTEKATWGPVDYANPKPGGPAGTWEETLEVNRRPPEELLLVVESRQLEANSKVYPQNKLPMLQGCAQRAGEAINAGTASATERAVFTEYNKILNAGFANYERAQELKEAILAGQPFDLNAGWVNEIAS